MKNILIFIALILFASCKKEYRVERSFYYWQNDSGYDIDFDKVKKLEAKKIYFKIFEIDYSETVGNFPFSKNRPSLGDKVAEDSLTIIPTIFIKNEIFQFNSEKDLDKLADNIVFLTDKFLKEAQVSFNEIQIDCD